MRPCPSGRYLALELIMSRANGTQLIQLSGALSSVAVGAAVSQTTNVVRNVDWAKQAMDAETLAFLLKSLKPSIVAAISYSISRQLSTLKSCLDRQEQTLADAGDFPGKTAIARDLAVAQALCKQIQCDLIKEFETGAGNPEQARSDAPL